MKRLFALLALCLPIYLFAQGFGSFTHDQPYFAADRASTNAVPGPDQNSITNIYRWWVASDVPVGQVVSNQWVDRINGELMQQGDPTRRPVSTSSGIYLDGTTFLTNNLLDFTGSTNPIIMYIGQVQTERKVSAIWMDRDTGNNIDGIIIHADAANVTNGFYVADSAAVPGHWGNRWWPRWRMMDFIQHANNMYLGGEFSSETTNGTVNYANYKIGLLGASIAPTNFAIAYIQELIVWTNTGYTGSVPIASTTISNLHSYATNKYGFGDVPPSEYRVWFQFDSDTGVTNSSGSLASNGDKVASWRDTSGMRNFLTNAPSFGDNGRPYYLSSGGPTNLPYLVFPDTNSAGAGLRFDTDYAFATASTNTAFWVIRFKYRLTAFGNVFDSSKSLTERNVMYHWGNDSLRLYSGTFLPASEATLAGTLITNQWMVVSARWGANAFIRTNGVQYLAGNSGVGSPNLHGLALNSFSANLSDSAYDDIAAMRFYYRDLSTNDIQYIEAQMATKYGITLY